MINIKKIISAYDLLRDDEWKIPVHKMNDEEIDALLDLQWDLLNQLPVIIAHRKQQTSVRLKAEKEEEACDVLLKRIYSRLDLEDYDCEYWKTKKVMKIKYDVDKEKLDKSLFMPNHASIKSRLSKNEKIEWVTPTLSYIAVKTS